MSRFIEIQQWGWNPESFVFIMVLFFGLYGAWGLCQQIRKVHSVDSSSVSVAWSITFAGMFSTYLPYGLIEDKLAIASQFFLRVPFYVVLLFLVYKDRGGFNRKEWWLVAGLILAIAGVAINHKAIFTGLSWLGAFIAADQPRQIFENKKRGSVSSSLLWAYMASIIFWLAYGYYLQDFYILSWASAYFLVYLIGLIMYYKYPNPKK